MITRSGKELKFVENKTMEDYFETTHLKLFQNFTGSLSRKTFVINTSRQNLPRWFDNDDFHCYHSGEVVETCFLPSWLYIFLRAQERPATLIFTVISGFRITRACHVYNRDAETGN